jgi:glycosyltransferase involved in cell wall biosynthesis
MTDCARLNTRGVALVASRLCILGDDPCGGSEVVLWEDARILQGAGIPVRVYACAARGGAPANVTRFRSSNAQLNTIEYARAVLRNEPESLIVAYNEPAFAGFAPNRTIVRFDWNTPLPRYWDWPMWRSRFQRARYLFPSEAERTAFREGHPLISSRQTFVIPNAVDLELFRPADQFASRSATAELRVGFAGQWSRGKGLQQLLDAWSALQDLRPAAQLWLAGGPTLWKRDQEPPGTREAVARVQEMQRAGIVHSVGSIPRARMPEFWISKDVAVVPSLTEAFGLVALEALACGVPVVATTAGGLKEIVIDGECGLLVPPGDTAALARALRLLLTDEQLRRRLSAAARLRAENFSLQRRSRELLTLFQERTEKAA